MNSPEKLKRRSTSDNYATPSKRSRLSRTLCSSASTTNSPSMKSTVSSTKSPLKMISIVQYFTQPKEESWCPLCQMPFDILSATQSKQTHVMMCSENNFDDLEACHEGLTCRSKVRNHYQRFNHQELAAARDFNEQPCAGEFEKPSSPINDETVADSDQVISSPVNARPSSSCDVTNNRFVCFAGDSGSEASIVSVSPSTARNPAANETESRSENKTDDLNKTLNEPEDIFSSESSLPTTALTTKKESRHPPEEVNLPSEANTDEVNITDRAVSNTSALSELMKVTAVEKSNGLHIEVKMKQNFGLSEVHLDIPKSDSTSKVIDVVGKYRAQSSIQSFFKSVGGSNSKAKDDRNSLTKTEIADALKKGFVIPSVLLSRQVSNLGIK